MNILGRRYSLYRGLVEFENIWIPVSKNDSEMETSVQTFLPENPTVEKWPNPANVALNQVESKMCSAKRWKPGSFVENVVIINLVKSPPVKRAGIAYSDF